MLILIIGQNYVNLDNATQIILTRLGYIEGAYDKPDVQFMVRGIICCCLPPLLS